MGPLAKASPRTVPDPGARRKPRAHPSAASRSPTTRSRETCRIASVPTTGACKPRCTPSTSQTSHLWPTYSRGSRSGNARGTNSRQSNSLLIGDPSPSAVTKQLPLYLKSLLLSVSLFSSPETFPGGGNFFFVFFTGIFSSPETSPGGGQLCFSSSLLRRLMRGTNAQHFWLSLSMGVHELGHERQCSCLNSAFGTVPR